MSLEPREFTHICWRCGAWFTNNEMYAGGICKDCEEATKSEACMEAKARAEALKRREIRDREYAMHAPKTTVYEENGVRIERYGVIPAGANAPSAKG